MLENSKFYNRNRIAKLTGLSFSAVQILVDDLPVTKIGHRKVYKGVDVLNRLTPESEK